MTMKQEIGILMEIDPATFWSILLLYSYEEEYISSLISSGKIYSSKQDIPTRQTRLIDDLCAINDGGEFGRSIFDICIQRS